MSQVLNLFWGGLGNEKTQSISHIFTQAAHVDMILGWISLLRLGNLPFQLVVMSLCEGCTQVFDEIDSERKKMQRCPFLEEN